MWSTLAIHLKIDRESLEKFNVYIERKDSPDPFYPRLRIKIIYAKDRFIYALYWGHRPGTDIFYS
ncbi:hypothetical protein FAD_0521 [Ferroplasma acidiphilum]|jgi:hypothetical protein|uniref:Uncharacterized protein n=1 Tax=Ferroplasma acidiphilum TaxID=74969 RepID=A0A1V0N2W0_9ARCH|nr:hypothetical protein FAD_0521 [Ferroplasma acidiphilum]